MDNFSVVKASDNLENGIDGTNVRQESVTETLTLRSTLGQTGNIVNSDVSGDLGSGLVDVAELVETGGGDNDTGLLRLNSGEGVVGRVTKRTSGNCLEKGRFTNVGQTNNTGLKKTKKQGVKNHSCFYLKREIG